MGTRPSRGARKSGATSKAGGGGSEGKRMGSPAEGSSVASVVSDFKARFFNPTPAKVDKFKDGTVVTTWQAPNKGQFKEGTYAASKAKQGLVVKDDNGKFTARIEGPSSTWAHSGKVPFDSEVAAVSSAIKDIQSDYRKDWLTPLA